MNKYIMNENISYKNRLTRPCIFIVSNPHGRTLEQRRDDNAKAIAKAKEYFDGMPIDVIGTCGSSPSEYTKSVEMREFSDLLRTISKASAVVFVYDWYASKKCSLIHECCDYFDRPMLYVEEQ